MREFLEDAHQHMDDGYGRAQKHAQIELRKRFYKDVTVGEEGSGFDVRLDGRPIKTPGMKKVVIPTAALADLVRAEWVAQQTVIDPRIMPVTRLVNAAVEAGAEGTSALRDMIESYAGNDLLLYRADSPQELVEAQNTAWNAVLSLLLDELGADFEPVVGIIHRNQPPESLEKIAATLVGLDHFGLTALASITNLTGSGLLAVALMLRLVGAESCWTAAHVDEDHNARLWGADSEAVDRRNKRRLEFDAAVAVLNAIST